MHLSPKMTASKSSVEIKRSKILRIGLLRAFVSIAATPMTHFFFDDMGDYAKILGKNISD
jgi:hypothetical protein